MNARIDGTYAPLGSATDPFIEQFPAAVENWRVKWAAGSTAEIILSWTPPFPDMDMGEEVMGLGNGWSEEIYLVIGQTGGEFIIGTISGGGTTSRGASAFGSGLSGWIWGGTDSAPILVLAGSSGVGTLGAGQFTSVDDGRMIIGDFGNAVDDVYISTGWVEYRLK